MSSSRTRSSSTNITRDGVTRTTTTKTQWPDGRSRVTVTTSGPYSKTTKVTTTDPYGGTTTNTDTRALSRQEAADLAAAIKESKWSSSHSLYSSSSSSSSSSSFSSQKSQNKYPAASAAGSAAIRRSMEDTGYDQQEEDDLQKAIDESLKHVPAWKKPRW